MSTKLEKRLLTIERDRLREMIEELEERSSFVWDGNFCSVCQEAEEIKIVLNCGGCAVCWKFGISNRCDYINDFWENLKLQDEGVVVFNLKEIEYLQDLFANYIRQIDERLEGLK